jgi:hypothetical protein
MTHEPTRKRRPYAATWLTRSSADQRSPSLPLVACPSRWRRGQPAIMLALAMIAVISCRRASIDDIPGTYSVKYAFGDEILTIKPDGKYTQVITVDGAGPITAAGAWAYDSTSRQITLRDHVMAHDGYGGTNPNLRDPRNRWASVLTVKKDLANHVVIIASADGSGFDYRKESKVR